MGKVAGSPRNNLLLGVMLAVGIWGGLLALGAALFGVDESGAVSFSPNLARGLIVLCCVSTFLGGWAALLVAQRNRRG